MSEPRAVEVVYDEDRRKRADELVHDDKFEFGPGLWGYVLGTERNDGFTYVSSHSFYGELCWPDSHMVTVR